jgi:hypothetical protein
MGFFELTAEDLSNYAFTGSDLTRAQDLWADCVTRFGAEKGHGRSRLKTLLDATNAPAAVELVVLARNLAMLSQHLTAKSVPVFEQKLRELFRIPTAAQFEELAGELTIGAAITAASTPIALEPYVPTGAPSHARLRSPDYAIRTPDGDIAIEATTLRVEAFERWDRLTRAVAHRVGNQVDKRKKFISFELAMPLSVRSISAGNLLTRVQVNGILATEIGSLTIPLAHRQATLRWSPMPVLGPSDPIPAEATTMAMASEIGALASGNGWSFAMDASLEEIRETILASLRQTVDAKLAQHPGVEQLLIVWRMGHHRLLVEAVSQLVVERLWPNPKYKRVTGIGFYEPWIPQKIGERLPKLVTLHNPHADPPASPAFLAVISGTSTYHDSGRPSA